MDPGRQRIGGRTRSFGANARRSVGPSRTSRWSASSPFHYPTTRRVSSRTLSIPSNPGQVFGLAGPTPADVIREIEQLVDVGVKHIALNFDDLRGIRRFAHEVVPHLRL